MHTRVNSLLCTLMAGKVFFQRIYDAFDSKSRVEDIKAEFFCMLKAEILGLKTLGLISVDTKYEPGNT